MRPRVGHIQFLNCLPLYHMLVKNGAVLDIDLCKDTPVELCNRLLAGRLDISPVPAIEYARHARDLLLLPGIAVASDNEVMSIVIVSKCPLQELPPAATVALTNTSRTSQVLARIVLKNRYGQTPRFFECPPDLPEMFREAAAALLIGDDALRVYADPGPWHVCDLGAAWKELTGEKMVYAVWAVRRDFGQAHPESVNAVMEMFRQSREMVRADMAAVAADIARWEPFSAEFLERYFQALRFDFDTPYQQGLLRYLHEARAIGFLDHIPDLAFVSPAPGRIDTGVSGEIG